MLTSSTNTFDLAKSHIKLTNAAPKLALLASPSLLFLAFAPVSETWRNILGALFMWDKQKIEEMCRDASPLWRKLCLLVLGESV